MYDTRPTKRQRTLSVSPSPAPLRSSSLTPLLESPKRTPELRQLPPAILLLALPGLLAHPPTHPDFGFSLFLSLRALRQCLALPALAPDLECRAWTSLAEVGMRVMESGFCAEDSGCDWAVGIYSEVEKALSKSLLIAQKHPSLRPLRHHLTLLHAHFAFTFPSSSTSPKFARAILRRLVASFVLSDPPGTVYAAHLALITQMTTPLPSSTPGANLSPAPPLGAPALQATLTAIDTLITLARKNHHPRITALAHVIKLRVLLRAGAWTQVGAALDTAEAVLGLTFDKDRKENNEKMDGNTTDAKPVNDAIPRWNSITAHDVNALSREYSQVHITSNGSNVEPTQEEESTQSDPAHSSLVIHTLLFGTIFFTFSGNIRAAEQRLVALHAIVDSGALDGFKDGIVQIPLPPHPPLAVHTTHPLILLPLTFLVSATAKRDPVGRSPKRRLWAEAGINIVNGAGDDIERTFCLPLWASLADRDEIIQRTVRLRADLLCELVAISIQRSEFDAAETHLNALLSLTHTHDLFHNYSARITLHAAHLAHALGDSERASVCYRVARAVDDELNAGVGYVGAAACAGEALLRIGMCAQEQTQVQGGSADSNIVTLNQDANGEKIDWLDEETHALAKSAIQRCHGMGGTLEAVGKVVQAAVAGARGEIVGAKYVSSLSFCFLSQLKKCTELILTNLSLTYRSHLKSALSLSTLAGENHLRALLLAQVGAQYLHTAPAHAMETLAVCETLGAGMGAGVKVKDGVTSKGKEKETGKHDAIGNAPLRLWVGERFLEIFKRADKPHRVAKQETYNVIYRDAVEGMVGRARWPATCGGESDQGNFVEGEDINMQNADPDPDVEM
ncbi:uncharacterized protein EDB91DRAFT_1221615 [Suillus paluster]|uniref:uncharacterized protein n=1 Tax=Suillus paluster TaxID=48578 RepID=UPI001B865B3B|nr:uncharacterized protein EDB91DRAFT_1221615 [Suillus paluster]KAG1742661.1 hypothetical protein EDB91DRAFT_1221615 [Suillus paluster]